MKRACIIAGLAGLFAATALAQAKPDSTWIVHYLGGPFAFPPNAKAALLVGADSLTVRWGAMRAEIPRASLTFVTHTPVRFSRAAQVGGALPGPGGGYGPGAGGYAVLYLLALAVASPMHGQSHYLLLRWTEDDVVQEMMLEAGKNDYAAVMQALERFSGVKWIDLEQDWFRAQSELQANKDKCEPLSLERPVTLPPYMLAHGPYCAVLLSGVLPGVKHGEAGSQSAHADLYLFAGNSVQREQLKAILPVQVEESSGAPDSVEYTPVAAGFSVSQIHLHGKTLTVLPK